MDFEKSFRGPKPRHFFFLRRAKTLYTLTMKRDNEFVSKVFFKQQ